MIRILIIIGTLALASFGSSPHAQPRTVDERVEALFIGYITNQLQLTPDESRDFWPLYNQYKADRRKLRESYKPTKRFPEMTDIELEEMISISFELEQKELDLKRNYYQKLGDVLPTRKIARLNQVERNFKERILKRWMDAGRRNK